MGQKVHPTIFRLGKTKTWKDQYFEKKLPETAIYSFKSVEIKKFIYKFFQNNGLTVQNCKLHFLDENSLHIFISYYLTLKSLLLITEVNKKQNIKLVKSKQKINLKKFLPIKKNIKNYFNYQRINYNNILNKTIKKKNFKKVKIILKTEKNLLKSRRMSLLKIYKQNTKIQNYKKIKNLNINSFLENFFKSLHIFLNKNINIFLTLQQLNKNFKQTIKSKESKLLKKNIANLRKYEKNEFFKEGINTLYICSKKPNSSELLATFIATQLRKLKRHNFFLKFLKSTLAILESQNIKIKIKGRFNGAPRAKHKIINVGNGVPALTMNSSIDYSEKTAYTSNGTFGVKVWIYEN